MEYSNSEMTRVIAEYIHSERDRKILFRVYVDGVGQEKIAAEMDLSPRQIQNIIYKHQNTIIA